jgi:hypothetical protein
MLVAAAISLGTLLEFNGKDTVFAVGFSFLSGACFGAAKVAVCWLKVTVAQVACR